MLRYFQVLILIIAVWPWQLQADLEKTYRIKSIRVEGNERIDSEAILLNLKVKAGSVSSSQITDDVKTLYRTGFFEQVNVEVRDGKTLAFVVLEKPVVRKVFVRGNENVSEDSLKEVISFGERKFVDKTAINGVIKRLKLYYQQQGYYDASADFATVPVGDNQVDITLTVDEGKRYKIKRVEILGVKAIDEDDILDVIQTKRYKWWNSWILGTGRLNPDQLSNDKIIIRQFLLDHGYVDGQVGEPAVEKRDGKLYVLFDISEGEQYQFGEVSAAGDLIDDSIEATLDGVEIQTGEVFNASSLREDSFKISDKFGDVGYAFANVVPQTDINRVLRTVGVTFEVEKGDLVTVDKINITGNSKTYDNVIRREMRIGEQEQYSGKKIKRSQTLLQRLGYFEEVTVNSEPGKDPATVDLNVNVREASTGSFSAGAGYSSSDGALFNARLSENNFRGTGKRVVLNVDVGARRNNVIVSYDDRRFRDTFWSFGLDGFVTEREFSDFDRQVAGGGFTVGYPLEEFFGEWAEDVAFSVKYEYLGIDITDVDPEDAAPLVIRSEGKSTASGITPRLVRNTINNPLNPTSGSQQSLAVEVTGLGGSEEYFLVDIRNKWYQPLFEIDAGKIVFSWRTRFGYGETFDGDEFPLFRRFFPGGINSVRGFKNRTLGPRDEEGNEFGGSKQLINNFEFIFPLVSSAGLKGVTFFDIGEAFDDNQSIDFGELRQAYGYGIRWISPLGPIRIEFGFPLDKEEGEDSMVTLFSFGAPL